MSRISEIEAERDAALSEIDHNYRDQQNAYEQEKEQINSRAAEKQSNGEDISAEVKENDEVNAKQDKRFDEYEADRAETWDKYQNQIDEAQQEEQGEEEDYGY